MKVTRTPKPKTMRRTYNLPIDLSSPQEILLCFWLAACAYVYNWALNRRREQYEAWKTGQTAKKALTNFDQKKELVAFRALSVALMKVPSDVLRSALDRLDRAFDGFFRRCAAGEEPGYPRVRRGDRYDSFSFPWANGMIVGDGRSARLRIPLFGHVKINLYRELRGTPKEVTIRRESTGRWWACISCDLGDPPPKQDPTTIPTDRMVGIDLGLGSLVATSDGELIDNPRHFKHMEDKLAERQRRVAKQTQKGSNGHKRAKRLVAKIHKKIANQRRDFLRKLSKTLVSSNALIAFECLNIKGLAQGWNAKSVNNAAWRLLINMILCKAEEAGTWAIGVDPRHTSQECCGCGNVVPKTLQERAHHCSQCGMTLDRDVNAARVILMRAVAALGTSVEQAPEAHCSGKARRSKTDGGDDVATQL